MNMKNYFT